jgi:hypothetical protein
MALGAAGALVVWLALLATLCSQPEAPDPGTGHTIATACHGSTVYLTALEDGLLHWLIPAVIVAMLVYRVANRRG